MKRFLRFHSPIQFALVATALDAVLISLGIWRYPSSLSAGSSGWFGLVGASLVLFGCLAAVIWGAIPGMQDHLVELKSGLLIAIIASMIFTCQFLIEYLGSLTSAQDSILANITFGSLFLLFLIGGISNGHRQHSARAGLLAGLWSGIFYSLAWVGLLWITFHLFAGTSQEAHFLEIDQTLADFQYSGMSDLRAFIVQDYLGATVFHPVLGAASGCLFGFAGGAAGKVLARWF